MKPSKDFFILGSLFSLTAFDTLLLGFAIPKLIDAYNITKTQAGLLGTALMVGVGAGALILGAVSDIVGRKRVILTSLVTFSLFTALLSLANSFESFLILLFLSGFGLGGGLTMSIAYLPEVVGKDDLEKHMCYFESFWGVGAISIVAVSTLLLERPLKELFLVGFFPLLFLPLFVSMSDVRYESKSSLSKNIADLFSKYGKVTAILWVIWFCGVYTYYGIFLWLPEVMRTFAGYYAGYSLLMPIYGMQILSPLALSFIVRKDNAERLLFIYSLLAATATFISVLSGDVKILAVGMLVTSFFSIGGWVLFILATQKSYPQRIRGIGVGSAASVGRIGGIVAPFFTGYLMDLYSNFVMPFTVISAMFVTIALLSIPLEKIRKSIETQNS